MSYAYIAYDRSGKESRGKIDAPSEAEAADRLRHQGLFVTEIKAEGGAGGATVARGRGRRGGRLKNLSIVSRQMAVLLGSGTPVVGALTALELQLEDPRWRAVMGDVRARVEEGSTLADAMGAHPHHFDAIARSLVAAGEAGGNLDKMMDRLATLTRQQLHVRNSLAGAMVYPSLLIVVALSVLMVMILLVLPKFAGLFESMDMPLPFTTEALLAVSNVIRGYWWIVVPVVLACGAGLVVGLKTPRGVAMLHTLAVRAPQVGRLTRSFATARVTRILGVLLESRVPMLDALRLTSQAAGNRHYVALMERVQEGVTRGEPVSVALSASALVTPSVCEAIRNGERSGRLSMSLLTVADFLDQDNDVLVKSLTSIFEPVILLVLGLVVGIVAMSLFVPLFDLTSMTQGGA